MVSSPGGVVEVDDGGLFGAQDVICHPGSQLGWGCHLVDGDVRPVVRLLDAGCRCRAVKSGNAGSKNNSEQKRELDH